MSWLRVFSETSLWPRRDDTFGFASRLTSLGPAWLSFLRWMARPKIIVQFFPAIGNNQVNARSK